MPGEARAIRQEANRPEDLHASLDEAFSRGAIVGVSIMVCPEYKGPEAGSWEEWATDGKSPAERAFIHQQLIVVEIADQR